MTWRQHRSAAGVGGAILLVIAAGLLWLGVTARSKVRQAGLTSCLRTTADCSGPLSQLQRDYHWLPPVAASLFALPLLAGMFWGAPLIAREIETGTHRLVWTQSVSRLRWISTKLALVLGVAAAATLALSLFAVWAFAPLIPVLGNRFRGGWFDVQGFIPAAYMLFALALGACMGAIWRRTLPAMATTIVAYAAARIPLHTLRPRLLSSTVKVVSAVFRVPTVRPGQRLRPPPEVVRGLGRGDWILSTSPTRIVSGTGGRATATTVYRYIPSGRFWTLQGIEASIFLALTAVLVAVCITVVVRSRPH